MRMLRRVLQIKAPPNGVPVVANIITRIFSLASRLNRPSFFQVRARIVAFKVLVPLPGEKRRRLELGQLLA